MNYRIARILVLAIVLACVVGRRITPVPEPVATGIVPPPNPNPSRAALTPQAFDTAHRPSLTSSGALSANPSSSHEPGESAVAADLQVIPAQSVATEPAPSLSQEEWGTIEEQIRAAQYHFTPHDPQWSRGSGWTAANPQNQFGIHIDDSGISAQAWASSADSEAWTWRLTLIEPAGRSEAGHERVHIRRNDDVDEWFHNTPQGVEHGMTLPSRQATVGRRNAAGERVIPFAMESSLQPQLADDGRSVHWHDTQGQLRLRYEDLWVVDARGRSLPSRMILASAATSEDAQRIGSSAAHVLSWVFDDSQAEYPVTVDPRLTRLEQRLLDPALSESTGAGSAVSVSGNALVIGAPRFSAQGVRFGTVLVFRRDAFGLWSREAQIDPPSLIAELGFGSALALEGDVLAVGAPATNAAAGPGFVTIHARNQGGANRWGRVKTVTPAGSNPDSADFGAAVSLSGSTLAVGAPGHTERGRVLVFERDQGGSNQWGQTKELQQSVGDFDPALPDRFGESVSLRDDVLVVGAPGEGTTAAIGGAVYIHERQFGGPGQWGLRKREFGSVFEDVRRGRWVSTSGTHVAFSVARVPIPNSTRTQNEFVVLERDASRADGWRFEEQFTVAEADIQTAQVGQLRGFALSGNLLAVTLDIGQGSSFHLFERSGTPARWLQIAARGADGATAIQGTLIAVGQRVFERPRTAWTFMAAPAGTSPTDGPGARLGRSVALDGEVLVVGAPRAISPGITNGSPNGASAGAAFVFYRNRGTQFRDHAWGLVKTLSLPDPRNGDEFGASVAIRQDWIAIGAPRRTFETRISAGGSSVQTNRIPEAGAVFLFRRDLGGSDNWGFDGEIINPQPVGSSSARSRFGFSLGLTEQFLAVGAPGAFSQESTDERGAVFLFQSSVSATQADWSFLKRVPHSAGRREEFGFSLAIDNDVLVVGSPARERTDTADATDPGMVLVFQRDVGGPNQWGLDQALVPSGAITPGERFGHSVAVATHRIVVGAPGTDQAVLFAEGPAADGRGGWRIIDTLRPPNPSGPSLFGRSVALDGPTALVGAPAFGGSGAAFVFAHRPDTTLLWQLEATLVSISPRQGAEFGAAVALRGQDLAVGEPSAIRTGPNSGTVSVFHRQFRELSLQTVRTSEDIGTGDRFGFSVALDGDQLLVGAPFDNGPGADSGAAYLFQRIQLDGSRPNWRQFRKLTASDAATGDNFGVHVALHNTVAAVGAFRKEIPGNNVGEDGAAYIFERNAGGADAWGQSRRLTGGIHYGVAVAVHDHRVAVCSEFFNFVDLYERNAGATTWGRIQHLELDSNANKLALHGDLLACGSEGESIQGQANTGAVYLFDRHLGGSNRWGLATKLLGTSPGGRFGSSVDVQGNLVVVGSRFENGGPADREPEHGRVRIFERFGDTAFRVADSIQAPDSTRGARFGTWVALDQDLLLVGAIQGNRSATATRTGTAYLFERNRSGPGRWQVTQKLTGADTQSGDEFGSAVDLSGRTAVVGARSFGAPGTGNTDQGRIFVFQLAGSGYDSFLARFFPGEPSGVDRPELADLADVDQDGLSNLAEAAFGTDPTVPDAEKVGLAVAFSPENQGLSLTFTDAAEPLGVQTGIEWSPDLVSWYASGDGPGTGPAPEIRIVTSALEENSRFRRHAHLIFPTSNPTGTSAFLRVRVRKQ